MEKVESNKKVKKKVNIRFIIVTISILIFTMFSFIKNRAKYLQLKEIGDNFVSVFKVDFYKQIIMFIVSFSLTYLIFYINNLFIKRGLKKFSEENEVKLPKLPNKSISLIAAIISGTIVNNVLYNRFLTITNAASFGIPDPLFGKDIGFFIFALPFIKSLIVFLIVFFLILILYTAVYYVLAINICFRDGINVQSLKTNTFVKQIEVIVMIFTVLMTTYIFVMAQDIQTGQMISMKDKGNTSLVGAGLSDISIKLWGYRILAVIVFVSVILILKNLNKSKFKKCVKISMITPMYLVVMFVVLIYFQEIYVGSSEFDKEKSYIGLNIRNTKEAFGVDIDQNELEKYESISAIELQNNSDVIKNVPLLSKDVTLEAIKNMQDNSSYYNYENTNLSWVTIDGKKKLVYLTPREINSEYKGSYNNETYEYTHGFSSIISSATNIDKNGYPQMIQSDFLPSENDAITITQPRIYFGMTSNNPIIVNSKYGKEFDYPTDSLKFKKNVYDGKAGLDLDFFDRLVLSFKTGNYGLAFNTNMKKDSKIITNRNILERVKIILPYIKYDENPYLVINDQGRLVWVVDGYTTSNKYPYSQAITIVNENGMKEKINYIRNSVKVLIDAYDGTTNFYITDRNDPIIMMYNNLYPNLFTNEKIPEDIKEQFKYPQYLFDIQSQVVATYHNVTEDILYRADDLWKIALEDEKPMESMYTTLKHAKSENPEFGLIIPYTKEGKESLTGYLVGTYENGKAKLNLYKFPSESSVAGISQLNSLIEQDKSIAKELKAIDVSGTKLVKNTVIVPIDDTLLYIEAIHQERLNEKGNKVLKKVIVSSGNKVAIGNDLTEAILNLVSDNKSYLLEFVDMENIEQVILSIIEANNNLQESIEAGNFEMIGKDIVTLEKLIDQLEVLKDKENEKNKK